MLFLGAFGCSNKTGLSAQEETQAKLTAAPWGDPEVIVDGIDQSGLYKNFSITFSKGSYSTTSGAPMWAASGTWEFLNQEATLMKFDGAREIEINAISTDHLELSFQWEQNTFNTGRTNSVKGKQKFKLKKNP